MNKRYLNAETEPAIVKDTYNAITLDTIRAVDMNNQVADIVADEVINAIANTNFENNQNIDFKIILVATINVGNSVGSIQGNYEVNYRYDKIANELIIKRVANGELFNISTEYISATESAITRTTVDEKGIAKKVSISAPNVDELYLYNNPFKAIIDHIDANNLLNIIKLNGDYMYKANLVLPENNKYLLQALDTIRKMKTTVDISKVSISNLASGLDFYFNMNADKSKITEFRLCVDLDFSIKGIDTKLAFAYEQRANILKIQLPETNDIITDLESIAKELGNVMSALNVVKKSATYSLELEATNQLVCRRNYKTDICKFNSRLIKNTNDKKIVFKQTCECQSHLKSGKLNKYKYIYGNIEDGSTYLVMETSSNEAKPIENISVNTQFDYMVSVANIYADSIDCIKKSVNKDGIIKYHFYINNDVALSLKDKIRAVFNPNITDGVIGIENFFNKINFIIDNSVMVVDMVDSEIKSIAVDNRIKYYPNDGDFIDEQITLLNSTNIKFNTIFHKASKYKAPKNAIELLKEYGTSDEN